MKINSMDNRYSGKEHQSADLRMDSKGKEVQNQILDAKKRLKELSSDNALSEEEKERKRQQIQQQLTDLKKELKARQLELNRTQQEKKYAAQTMPEDNAKSPAQNQPKETNPPATENTQTGTKAIIAAKTAVNHASAHGKLAAELKSKVRILQGEIRQDEARGKDTSHKQKELKKLEDKTARLNGVGSNFLADVSKELQKAMEKESKAGGKIKKNNPDGFVRPLKSPLSAQPKAKTNIYMKRNPFSTVDFHF